MPGARLPIGLAAVVLLALLAPSAAAHGGWRSYIVSAHDAETPNGTVAWFNIDNRTEPNPNLTLHRNETIVLHFVNLGSRNHTLSIGPPIDTSIGPVAPDNESSASFQVPDDAPPEIVYQDPAWADRGMRGVFTVPGADAGADAPGLPSAGIAVLLAGAALIVRRRRAR